jgi:predicted acyl esterase
MSFYFMTMSIALLGKMRKHRFRMTRSHVQSHPDTKGQILAVTLRADTKVVVFSQQTLLSLSLSLSLFDRLFNSQQGSVSRHASRKKREEERVMWRRRRQGQEWDLG